MRNGHSIGIGASRYTNHRLAIALLLAGLLLLMCASCTASQLPLTAEQRAAPGQGQLTERGPRGSQAACSPGRFPFMSMRASIAYQTLVAYCAARSLAPIQGVG